jgi:hypothetical protein
MSTKQGVINELSRILSVVEIMEGMDCEKWQIPIAEGKFSSAAIVSHLMYWDRFLIQFAIPDVKRSSVIDFPDHDKQNELSAIYSTLISKEMLINEFKEAREKLMSLVSCLPTDFLQKEITVNGVTHCPKRKVHYTLEYILEEFVLHDNHHVKQLKCFLEK